jgi:hypothetical protein
VTIAVLLVHVCEASLVLVDGSSSVDNQGQEAFVFVNGEVGEHPDRPIRLSGRSPVTHR